MPLFAPAVAFVDLETTGTRAPPDRITEVGIVRVEVDPHGGAAAGGRMVLAGRPGRSDSPGDPGAHRHHRCDGAQPHPRSAPSCATSRRGSRLRLRRAQRALRLRLPQARVRAARAAVQGEGAVHGATVAAAVSRGALAQPGCGDPAPRARDRARHRALGDAQALWQFVAGPLRNAAGGRHRGGGPSHAAHSQPARAAASRRSRCRPGGPGVYLFYGDNPLPLYIGKSRNLRERVGAHFSSDWASETDLRLSSEIRRIEFEPTAGELGALLREATLVKALFPAHNRALRRKADAGVMTLRDDGTPAFVPAAAYEPGATTPAYGPCRHAARCAGPSPRSRTIIRCAGSGSASSVASVRASRASSGAVRAPATARSRSRPTTRVCAHALAPLAIPRWPFEGPRWSAKPPTTASGSTSTSCATGHGSVPRATTASCARLLERPPHRRSTSM